jgi:hypothetical protein
MSTTNFKAADADGPVLPPGAVAGFSIGDVLPQLVERDGRCRDNKR